MNLAQQEQLNSVGAYLRDLRKEKGATVDEVANQIFIRPALVTAIETGDWESLPEPVFVQGFIRRYADYLGLNGREVASQFEPTPVAVLPDPALASSSLVEGVIKQQDRHGLKVLSKAEPISRNGAAVTSNSSFPLKWNWVLGVSGLVVLGGLIVWLTTRNTPQPSTASTNSDVEAPTPASEPAAETEVLDTETTEADGAIEETETATLLEDSVTFAVNLEQDAWMRITVDGEVAYEGILPAGSEETWTAEEEIAINAGNSGGVLFSFNGSDEQPLGQPGQVRRLVLTSETDPSSLTSP
ncbi:MAG: RodZ domain-containing protein [Cyanobacteria bacterium P01_C01_bin.120]